MCGIAGLYNFGGGAARRARRRHGDARRDEPTAAPTTPGCGSRPTTASCSRTGGCRSSTCRRRAISRCPTRTARSGSRSTARSTTTPRCAPASRRKGHRFRSRTDTEAIVHLYEETGRGLPGSRWTACSRSRSGTRARERLLLARDRLGKKPLYYTVVGGRLLFASEIKGLLAHPDVARDIDPEGLNQYLTFGNVPAPHTLFAGINKLPAAHRLICDRLGNVTRRALLVGGPGRRPGPRTSTSSEAVERVRELLTRGGQEAADGRRAGRLLSVGRRRLERQRRADEPAASIARCRRIRSGSRASARRRTSTTCRTRGWSPSASAATTTRSASPPTSAATTCPSWSTSRTSRSAIPPACRCTSSAGRRASDGVIVVLVGEGSDEVFGGYGDMAHMLERRVAPRGTASGGCRASCAPACTRPAACCARPRGAPTCSAARATGSRCTGASTSCSGTARRSSC